MIKNERIKKYQTGCFDRRYYWDCSRLPDSFDGLLFQHIIKKSNFHNFTPNSFDITRYNCSYFEFWEIKNSTIVSPQSLSNYNSTDFDDWWCLAVPNWVSRLQDCAIKYKSSGNIDMKGQVYLIDSKSVAYRQIKKEFHPNCKVKSSGDLPSMLESLYMYNVSRQLLPDPSQLNLIFSHEFSNSWDFTTDISFIDAVKEIFDNNNSGIENDIKCFSELAVYPSLKQALEEHYNISIKNS